MKGIRSKMTSALLNRFSTRISSSENGSDVTSQKLKFTRKSYFCNFIKSKNCKCVSRHSAESYKIISSQVSISSSIDSVVCFQNCLTHFRTSSMSSKILTGGRPCPLYSDPSHKQLFSCMSEKGWSTLSLGDDVGMKKSTSGRFACF